jgi:peroxiredoxin
MARPDDLRQLPADLPRPPADGGCDHLPGCTLPSIALPSTAGRAIDLAAKPGRLVLYCFPRAGQPDAPSPAGWDQIPGARGCTPQSLAFRAHHQEIQAQGALLFGLSTQSPAAQAEIATRLTLPFPLLSDADLAFAHALALPTFEVEGQTLIRRLTLIATNGTIEHVFYPVFPPDQNAADVVAWLQTHRR